MIFILFCAFAKAATAQSSSLKKSTGFEAKTFEHKGKTLGYQMLKPKNFDPNKTYPVHLFLHGAGERGDDNTAQLTHGSELFVQKNDEFPAIIIFPQCPKDDYWAQVDITRNEQMGENIFSFPEVSEPTWAMGAVISLMDEMVKKVYVDKSRIYVGGLSMGGMGTYEMLHRRPDMFAAATAICGGGNLANIKNWASKTPIWIFHGEDDGVVPARYSKLITEALMRNEATPKISFYPNVKHNSWDNAFSEPDFFSWIYSHTWEDANDDCTPQWLKFEEKVLINRFKEENEKLVDQNNDYSVVFMGDSITEGWLETSPDFWESHPEFINRGVSGQTTSQMLLRFRQDVIALKPKKVVILAGTNDIAGNTGKTSIETVAHNLFTMADLAKAHNISVVLCSVLPVYDYPWETGLEPAQKIIDLNGMIKTYAAQNNHTYVDYHTAMKNERNGMQSDLTYDGVHCTEAGYLVMEKLISAKI
ncbi:GDSL-type esterase/lipase family protein [Dokdonia sinensis]|uniref:GDSL-type esterase/lipase family protein n=1 Tax=Dokdonia sinensis TaxID=2479847 RepID=UPI001F2480B0|nr:GDSL-type esterase/lipase family protein [Dokdonia sinensis]